MQPDVPSLINVERAKSLHIIEESLGVNNCIWKASKARSTKHAVHPHRALNPSWTSILVRARTEHCGLTARLSSKNLIGSPAYECGHSDEAALHALLRCDQCAGAAMRCGKQQMAGGVTLRTYQEDGAVVRMLQSLFPSPSSY